MTSLKEKLKSLPKGPGVYLFKDKNGEIIYIGKAKSLRRRVASYFRETFDLKTGILKERLKDIDYISASSEMDALLLEEELVKKYKPRYNTALRDDKAYPLLKLTVNEKWPRLYLARKKEKDGALYFGRFSGGMAREVMRLAKKLFPIRWCKESPLRLRRQPCLYYRIGSCSGPCIGKVSENEYAALVRGMVFLFEGKTEEAAKKLEREMEAAAEGEDFERAAYLRDRMQMLGKLTRTGDLQKVPAPARPQALEDLKKALRLNKIPMRIEAFDISNISGSNIAGAMVTFFGGVPLKNDYRKFKVNSPLNKANDILAIYEVVKRRYAGQLSKKMALPDLIVVDGGRGQVTAGKKAVKEAGIKPIPVIGLAKREEDIYLPEAKRALVLPKSNSGLQLLQRVRDEAHRFALSYHRSRRSKEFFA